MNVSSLATLAASSAALKAKRTEVPADAASGALAKANDRIAQKLESAQVNLSAFGQLKSAFAELQTAGKALTDIKPGATEEDVTKAVEAFAGAFNKTENAAAAAAPKSKPAAAVQSQARQAGAPAGDVRAALAGSDLRRALQQGDALNDLKAIGITQKQDGSLNVDQKALANALQANPDQVRSVLANAGEQAEKTATQELADNGNVGGSVNALGKRVQTLAAQQTQQQAQTAAAQSQVEQQAMQIGNNALLANLATYQRLFTG